MKIILAASGGMDSTTLLGLAKARGHQVICIGFSYGSKHNDWEREAALDIVLHYGVPYQNIDITSAMLGIKSNLMKGGGDIPEGYYEGENMKLTVVPGRNMIFASILAGIAWSQHAKEVWLGIHSGDHAIYPDCRPAWYNAMREAIHLGTDGAVDLQAPFLHDNKTSIIAQGLPIKVPYDLTRTCYQNQATACGRCGSCQERLHAFFNNNMEDPIKYESRELIPIPKE